MGVEVVGCIAQVGIDLQTPAWVHLLPFIVTRHAHDGLERLERTPGVLAETHGAIKAALAQVPNVDVVFGEYDKIIPVRNANRLRRMTRKLTHVSFRTVRSGHNLLKPETMNEVVRCIFGS